MNSSIDSYPSIQICSLGAAREIDHSTYDGVITIEDSLVDDPLRIDESDCPQLVLCFDDIASPKDEWIMPKERHVRSALEFADELGGGSLLIHCHAGISRSSGIALAIIAVLGLTGFLVWWFKFRNKSKYLHKRVKEYIPPVKEDVHKKITEDNEHE